MKKVISYKKDIIFIAALITLGLVMGAFLLLTKKNNNPRTCVVKVDGIIEKIYPMDEDITVEIEGAGGTHNTLVIKENKACIKDADCPDGLCEKMGWIQYDSQSVICLPNKVVIYIEDAYKDENSIDTKTW